MPEGGVLASFYGDDFTGTMATAEIFTEEGLPTVVFIKAPALSFLRTNFPTVKIIGTAGVARTLKLEGLVDELTSVFQIIKEHRALVYLYKVCSTFDSSSVVGNIGRAIELAREAFYPNFIAVNPAAPRFGRYLLFGNMFAAVGKEKIYRLDRHPSMSTHPVTPMREADLLIHLSKQTDLPSGLVNIQIVERGSREIAEEIEKLITQKIPIIFFDCLHGKQQHHICKAIVEKATKPVFMVGSHEAAYGLSSVFRDLSLAPVKAEARSGKRTKREGEPVFVVSGSCATVTGRQILWARENGFTDIAAHPEEFLDPAARQAEEERIIGRAVEAVRSGESAMVHTAVGPDDERIKRVMIRAAGLSLTVQESMELIGNSLGKITRGVLGRSAIKRLIVAGGDTSGRIQSHLNVEALQVAASVGDPAPICYVYSGVPTINGVEIAFKGGQVGKDDYFRIVQTTKTSGFPQAALGKL